MPESSKEERRFFKLDILSTSLNAIAGFKNTAIMQIAIIIFNHLMADYLTYARYIDDLEKRICPNKSEDVQIWVKHIAKQADDLRWTDTLVCCPCG